MFIDPWREGAVNHRLRPIVTLWGPVLALGRCTTLSFMLTDLAGIKQQKKVGISVQNYIKKR